jgi:KDO2-lipid IV(A) lauroyltransferase
MRARLIRSLLQLLSLLPLRISHWLGAWVGMAMYLCPTRARCVTDVNLAACYPARDPAWRRRIARISLVETGKSLAEAPYLWRVPPARIASLVKETIGQSLMDEAIAKQRGVILAAPHHGCWELCGLYIATRYPITSLYRPPRMKDLEAVMRAGREHTGARLVPTDSRGVKSLIKALHQGQCVGILPDQVPNPGSGVYAPFFGISAYTMMLITRLAGKRQTPVIFMYAQRLRGGAGYRIHYRPADSEIYDPESAVAAAAVNLGVESMVRECPEQYAWSYKRFKDRPLGERSFYY